MTLLLTYPGVPSIFAGDELGLQGAWGEAARTPMPWGREDLWDHDFLAATKKLIAIRSRSSALADGGLRFLAVEEDHFIFMRELKGESIFVLISRQPLAKVKGAPLTPDAFALEGYTSLFDSPSAQIWQKKG
jgi:alpha-glucosidase